jgi:predicted transcriptional regulator
MRGRVEKPGLPNVADAVLIQRDLSCYKSNSEAEYAACKSLMGAKYSDEFILDLFRQLKPPHFARTKESNFCRYVLSKARAEFNQSHTIAPCLISFGIEYLEWAESHPWPGRTGSTDRVVFLALCDRMQSERKTPFRASIRELAELGGINKETAYNAIRRLFTRGIVRPEGKCEYTRANHYSLAVPVEGASEKCELRTLSHTWVYASHTVRTTHLKSIDAFHTRALGKTALMLCDLLRAHGLLTVRDISLLSGKHPSTIRRSLRRLWEHGIANCDKRGWWALEVNDENYQNVALSHGTLGAGEERRRKHEEQRKAYAGRILLQQIVRANNRVDSTLIEPREELITAVCRVFEGVLVEERPYHPPSRGCVFNNRDTDGIVHGSTGRTSRP